MLGHIKVNCVLKRRLTLMLELKFLVTNVKFSLFVLGLQVHCQGFCKHFFLSVLVANFGFLNLFCSWLGLNHGLYLQNPVTILRT